MDRPSEPASDRADEDLRDEVARLRKELARERRRADQISRVAATSEQLALQSKQALLRAMGDLETTVARLRDTTTRLELARRDAECASEAKSLFLANMSHEIRTPMHGVIGSLSLLSGSNLAPEQLDLVDLLERSSRHMLTILDDLLDFAKIESGELELECVPFRIGTLFQDVARIEGAIAAAKGVGLELDIDEAARGLVRGDEHRLRQVVQNLVSNAVKFTREGHVRIRVQRDDPDSGYLSVMVSDTGIGIPPAALDSVFEAFTQAEAGTTRLHGGTGLGLAICRRLAELMQGSIAVESQVGSGSTFTFRALLESAATRAEAHPPGLAGPRHSAGLSVLVVDDDGTNRKLAGYMLERLGCQVETVGNGQEALERFRRSEFDAVLMDGSMPGMDGFQTTAALRRLEQEFGGHTWVIALTAHAMSGDRERFLVAGMDDYVVKPCSMHDLRVALGRVPERRAAHALATAHPVRPEPPR